MTLEEQFQKWLKDHNGESPDIIGFNPSDLSKFKVDPIEPRDYIEIGGFRIKFIASPCMPEGSCLFMAKMPEFDCDYQPTEETIRSSIKLRLS